MLPLNLILLIDVTFSTPTTSDTQNSVLLSAGGVERSGTPTESKHPYLAVMAGKDSSLRTNWRLQRAMSVELHQFLNCHKL